MRGQVAVVVAAVGLVLAGCTTDADPVEPTTTEPTTTATPTPSPTVEVPVPPDRPEAMATPSADGAAAAAEYFLADLYPYTYESADLSAWDDLSSDDCEFCTAVREDVAEISRVDATSDQGAVTVEHSYGTEVSPGQWYRAELRFTQEASVRTDRNGAVLAESERSVADALIVLTWAEGWQIDAVDVSAVAG